MRNARAFVGLAILVVVALTPLSAVQAGAATASKPHIDVDPSSIADGQNVTFHGSGWSPGAHVTVYVCEGDIVSRLSTTVNEAIDIGFSGCAFGAQGEGPRFSATARMTQVQTYTAGCSTVCDTQMFTCGQGWGDCLVVAIATGASGALELATDPIRFTTAHLNLTVTPSHGLADGQTLTATRTGFTPNEGGAVLECESPWRPKVGRQPPKCETVALFGANDTTFRVRRVLDRFGPNPVDCARRDCVLQYTPALSLRVPLHFDANTPIIRPSLTVTPQHGLADGQTVTVTGRNFAVGSLSVHECTAGAAAIANQGIDAIGRLLAACGGGAAAAFPGTDPSGNFQTSISVSKHFSSLSGKPIDCTQGSGCVIDAGSLFPDTRFNSGSLDEPITFSP